MIAREIERGHDPTCLVDRAVAIPLVPGADACRSSPLCSLSRSWQGSPPTASSRRGSPGVDVANAFDAYGTRGVLIAITALVITAGAMGLGAVIGRVLPTVIVALILGALGLTFVTKFHADYTAKEAVIADEANIGRGDRYIDQFFRLPDGRLVGYEELYQIDPAALNDETGQAKYPIVALVIPGERYRAVEAREAAVLGGIAVVMLAGTAAIVQRRRPG